MERGESSTPDAVSADVKQSQPCEKTRALLFVLKNAFS